MKTYIYMVRHAVSPFVLGNERERGLSEKGTQTLIESKSFWRRRKLHILSPVHIDEP